ncbi:MAG: zf-HC2 domain-containing protein [Armatimonadetes bacterium]|nr:zf-HC2 domain-containing protein [Armatimonadota bacterium]
MDCSKAVEKLSAYIDGALDERTLELLEAHFAECPGCRNELAVLRTVVAATRHIELVQPPDNLKRRIQNSIRRAGALNRQCVHIAHLLSAYVDGELPPKQAEKVEAHAKLCERCANEINDIKTLVNASSQVVQVEPPQYLRSRIASAILREPIRQSLVTWIGAVVRTQAARLAYAGAAAALGIIALLNLPTQSPRQPARVAIEHHKPAATATVTVAQPRSEPVTVEITQKSQTRSHTVAQAKPVRHYRSVRHTAVASVPKHSKPKPNMAKIDENLKQHDTINVAVAEPDSSTTEAEEPATVDVAMAPTEPEVESASPTVNPPLAIKVPPPPTIDQEKVAEMMQKIKAEAAMRRSSSRTASVAILKWRL